MASPATYALPLLTDFPQNLRGEYRAGGFSENVRNWHLARIPRMIIAAGTYITCPWCGRERDIRSMQIDHIIPIQQYGRMMMLGYCRSKKLNITTKLDKELRFLLKTLYSDQENLLLSCMKCNAGAGNTMPTPAGLLAAAGRVQGTVLETRLKALVKVANKIRNLSSKNLPGLKISLREFILSGANWNTSQMETRHKPQIAVRKPADLEQYNLIHNTVVGLLVKGRPAFTITADILVPFQPSRAFQNEEGRLCFYCLGLFRKQAFQVDHINPASQRASDPAVYSDPTNLIPVCRTCNTSKGIKSLSTQWLDEQIQARQNQNLPGVEHAVGAVTPQGHADFISYVRAERIRVLGC
ncbi:MAG TPA: HNH endonuclease signature motif containing protein [Silvibacterium sp.]|nr:HNH endonuclease signature motif containing protein [Silvibacterium sp.]